MESLPYLGSDQRNSPDAPVVPNELQTGLCRVRSSSMNWAENTWAGPSPTSRSGDSSYWSACSTIWPPWRRKSIKGAPWRLQAEAAKEMAPEHPAVWTLIGSNYEAILQVAEQVYWGEWTLVPSVLSCQQQDDCMRELQELKWCMSRAGLQGAPGLAGFSRSRRHSCGHCVLQTHYPSAEPWGIEAAKRPREDSLMWWSGSWRWHPQLRKRSRSRQHQSPSPQCWGQSQSPCPSPLRSSPAG